ncbi:MAG: hypothetical protein AAF360_14475, partial [Pseudomonadota bacterium]
MRRDRLSRFIMGLSAFALAGCLSTGGAAPGPAPAQAQAQSPSAGDDFAKWEDGGVTGLAFEFRDALRETHRVAFAFPTAKVDAALRGFARFDPKAVDARYKAAYAQALDREIDRLRQRYPRAEIAPERDGRVRIVVRSAVRGEDAFADGVDILRREV